MKHEYHKQIIFKNQKNYNIDLQYNFSHSTGIAGFNFIPKDAWKIIKKIQSKQIVKQFNEIKCKKCSSKSFLKLGIHCAFGFYPLVQLALDTFFYHPKEQKFLKLFELNKQLYDICVKKMVEFGYLYKLFYFNLINIRDENFISLFQQFIPIFLSNKYDQCLTYYHLVNFDNIQFMKKYIDEYKLQTSDYNSEQIIKFQNKYKQLCRIKIKKFNSRNQQKNLNELQLCL